MVTDEKKQGLEGVIGKVNNSRTATTTNAKGGSPGNASFGDEF